MRTVIVSLYVPLVTLRMEGVDRNIDELGAKYNIRGHSPHGGYIVYLWDSGVYVQFIKQKGDFFENYISCLLLSGRERNVFCRDT